MKQIQNITLYIFFLFVAASCTTDEERTYSFDTVGAPTELVVSFEVADDNSGTVNILPQASGVVKYAVDFGDNASVEPTEYKIGEVISHIYTEGVYSVKVVAYGSTGESTVFTQDLNISIVAPSNLNVTIENDKLVSKQVNVTATADLATVVEVYFGDIANEEPTLTTAGTTVSHVYSTIGDYDVVVVAKNGAIANVNKTTAFTVTEIIRPTAAAPTPPTRADATVISIFSDAYTDVAGTNFNPGWGQNTIVTEEDLNSNKSMKYALLNYQGTQLASPVDASSMEFLHIDVWVDGVTTLNLFPISVASGEKAYSLTVANREWKSFDIPLSYFTNLGLSMADIHQFKFDDGGTGEAGTVFLDNIYFYKAGCSYD